MPETDGAPRSYLCERKSACERGVAAGYIPKPDDAPKPRIEVCYQCLAAAERQGFFCVWYGENEATASRRHDRIVDERHARVQLRRRFATTRAAAATTQAPEVASA